MNKTLPLLVLLLSLASFAQTTYQSVPNSICTGNASHYPITSFQQFACNNLQLEGGGAYTFRGGYDFTSLYIGGDYSTGTLALTEFTQPKDGNPGTFAYTATISDAKGTTRQESVSGTWVNTPPNWRGWIYVKIVESTVKLE